ncbi:MAG: hypothetical protein A2289_06760 [Deltaproteobacteria bacterium RIFOXYA12_FULL_58_15]|nr:MAG: hypothetical protein A2289_06760 [Deltaproteobacteria bacterium RIFOXYA12_FULL_58_15]OGR09464.1 MAG: hypothetical protein A2341_18210 [Deltaproteobacteria bacterium RIFOXYB12_FULL_58_9]
MSDSEPNIEIPIGTILADTYRIESKLAQGGMGAVFVARHVRLSQRRVAIKILFDSFAGSKEVRARFRREAEICAALSHPNIVSVTDWNELADGSPFLVMELLEGEDLKARMARGKVPWNESLHIIDGIADGLLAAHSQKVIHRDLKPSNIFLVAGADPERPLVKILDFGISKIADADTLITTSKILGTPRYMSPEQARGHNEVDERCDQFALACITYELLCGIHTFGGETFQSSLFNIVHEAPEPVPSCAPNTPISVIAAVYRALAKDREQRFASVREFVTALHDESSAVTESECLEIYRRAGNPPQDATVPADHGKRTNSQIAQGLAALTPDTHALSRGKNRRLVMTLLASSAVVALGVGAAFLTRYWRHTTSAAVAQAEGKAVLAGQSTKEEDTDESRGEIAGKPGPSEDGNERTIAQESPAPVVTKHNLQSHTPRETRKEVTVELPQVAAKLDAARGAFNAGQYGQAVRLAQQTLREQETPRARLLIASSYCQLGDLGNAKVAFALLAERDRRSVRDICKQKGLSL